MGTKQRFAGTAALAGALFLTIAALFIALGGCTEQETPAVVRLANRQPLEQLPAAENEPPLTISVGSMITPEDGYIYYHRLLGYIEKRLGRRIRALYSNSYAEVNNLLQTGEVDAAFVCGGPYVEGREKFGLELLAAPRVNGQAVYHSYLIVPAASSASSYEDLRGKTFAFSDPHSNSGMIAPSHVLAQMGETPDSFFKSYLFTYAHDRSIHAVADRMVDGAAVDSLIWEYLVLTDPSLRQKTKVIAKSPPFGIPPVVASPHLDPDTREKLKKILLEVHRQEEGREILRGMNIERFIETDDARYDSICQMRRFIAEQQHSPEGGSR